MKPFERLLYPTADLEKQKRQARFLRQLNKWARVFVLSGLIGGSGAGGVRYGLDWLIEKEYRPQIEMAKKFDLTKQDRKRVLELFGRYYPFYLKEKEITENVSADIARKRDDPKEGLRLLLGQKPEQLVRPPSGEKETAETEKTMVHSIPTGDGLLEATAIDQILQETLPKGWVNNEVEKVTYEERDGRATCYRNGVNNDKRKAEIVFRIYSRTCSLEHVVGVLGHEHAHANDWESDNEMTTVERVALILKIAERLETDDRFQSSYVEAINYENDPQRTRYTKAVEYWAVICQWYFSNADMLSIEDFKIVDSHIRKTDPKFNWVTAAARRLEIIRQMMLRQKAQVQPTETSTSENPTSVIGQQ